ncbi:hypothetical protein BS17DRAFT_690063 [Gyrodon lividus]|nr:hypothetical protein BS17DRAFT_690063 [Gyrodon lividus]
MEALWVESTKELYGSGLLVFHVHMIYCDINPVPKVQHYHISPILLLAFLYGCVGAYLGSATVNYASAIHT